jgi:hypothetical protein
MNVAKLIKLAPTSILVGVLGYALYSMESGIPEAVEKQAEMQKGLEKMVEDMLAEGSTAATKLEGKLRDPFWVAPAPRAPQEAPVMELPGSPEADELAEIVRGMALEATFLQGRDQLAVIDGRIYSRGQRIAIPGNDSAPGRSMQVVAITRTGVLLKGGDKHYNLGYPEQLGKKKEDAESESAKERATTEIDPAGQMEMFQRLLNSPLGAMGRGLIGDAAAPGRSAGAASKARGRRRPDSPARGSGPGGP